eukprot:CAMPEP_0118637786 /NCGR_PEP_ID=MMETSP0785-20121206/3337_1 /TAXON_ID=91992 /ORGANISM="Bolidomonas pacifica, Strain CCMP 1866" /LENGTH=285 /DNA_ID=CAMNT_0006528993 /DNA_START=278 /DNA_END=1134 /DNA_ORIENTATION=-
MSNSSNDGVPTRPQHQQLNGAKTSIELGRGLVNYIAGVLGGVTVTLIGHPFDTVKVRLQTQPTGPDALYKNTLDCVKKTYKGEGFSGFYAGVGSPLMGQMFFRAGSFAAFHEVHSVVQGGSVGMGKYEKLLLSGGVTGAIITLMETPIDIVKTKLQTFTMKQKINPTYTAPFHNTTTCIQFLIRKYGVAGLYQASSATMIRNIPANAVFFPVNEIMKDLRVAQMGYGGGGGSVAQRKAGVRERGWVLLLGGHLSSGYYQEQDDDAEVGGPAWEGTDVEEDRQAHV